jgi:hypothetical protein
MEPIRWTMVCMSFVTWNRLQRCKGESLVSSAPRMHPCWRDTEKETQKHPNAAQIHKASLAQGMT